MTYRQKIIKRLREFGVKNNIPNITDENARFIRDLIKIKQVKNMLEIGSANGFSALQFGLELEKTGGKLTTIEFSEPSYEQTVQNISDMGLKDIIFPINGNALFLIPELKETYDFVFIDAMKRRTKDFFDLIWDKVELGGVIIIDDVIKFKEKMDGFEEFLDKNKITYNLLPIDIDDGIIMIVKEKENIEFRIEKDYS